MPAGAMRAGQVARRGGVERAYERDRSGDAAAVVAGRLAEAATASARCQLVASAQLGLHQKVSRRGMRRGSPRR